MQVVSIKQVIMKVVNGIKIVMGVNGKPEFHIPSGMTGAAFTEWRRDNSGAIAAAIDSMSVPVASDSVTDSNAPIASPVKVVTIGKVVVIVSDGKLSFKLPDGMTAKGLVQWKRRNAAILSDLL